MFQPKNLKEAILATLAYFNIWHHPLTAEELSVYLFKCSAHLYHIQLYLNESPKIEKMNNFYCIKGSRENIVERTTAEMHARTLWRKISFFVPLLHIIPNVRMIAACNTLALTHPSEESDIDLFIVTKRNSLFISRFLITALLHFLRLRRHGNKIKQRFCLSFFIDETHLNLGALQLLPYDIYLAYWVKSLQPIFGMKTYEKFLRENSKWLQRYFEQPLTLKKDHLLKPLITYFLRSIQFLLELLVNNFLGEKIEAKLKQWQIARAHEKKSQLKEKTGIIIGKNILKFHNQDKREDIRNLWEENLRELRLINEDSSKEQHYLTEDFPRAVRDLKINRITVPSKPNSSLKDLSINRRNDA